MVHIHYFITHTADLDVVVFHDFWRKFHGSIVLQIPQLRAYVQSQRVEIEGVNTSPCDSVAEAWVEDESALQPLLEVSAHVPGALADEPNFIDMRRVEFHPTEDRVILEGTPKQGVIKGLYRIKRRPSMSYASLPRWGKQIRH